MDNFNILKGVEDVYYMHNDELNTSNANKDVSLIPTRRDLLAGEVSKEYAGQYLIPKHIMKAHEVGDIHYHDLDYAPYFPMFNCMLVDLKSMLYKGFRMGNAQIEPPKSIGTATAITAQVIAQVASHIYGGTTINRIDEVLEPFVYASLLKWHKKLSEWGVEDVPTRAKEQVTKDVYDAFQALEHEVNTLHTANGQSPFSTLGFGLGTSWGARLIQEAILKVRIDGLGEYKNTAIFPKLVFTQRKGHNFQEGDPFYDVKKLALKCASERMYPDILNYEKVIEVTGSFKNPMGCRSFLSKWEDEEGNDVVDGRNNLGVISINLPRLGLLSRFSLDAFWVKLDQTIDLAIEAAVTRVERFRGVKASVAPILYTEGACGIRLKPDDEVIKLFENGRATVSIGYIGIHETLCALFDTEDPYESPLHYAVGQKIIDKMAKACEVAKRKTGWGFSVYSTPSESLCNRFCELDKKQFGVIKGVTDHGYYTNSFHVDVRKKVNPYEKIKLEKPFPKLASGGFISYVEYPNIKHNLEALEDVWNFSYDKVPYLGTNTPIDRCFKCTYTGEFKATPNGFECPECGNKDSSWMNVTRRVCGYLGNPDARAFNKGKQEEVIKRVKHL